MGGGRAVVPGHPPLGEWRVAPAVPIPHGRQRGAAHPSLPHSRPGLFGSSGRRARSGRPPAGQSGGGGGGVGAPPLIGGTAGGPCGGGQGGRSASVHLCALPGRAPKWAASSLPCPPHCPGSRKCSPIWVRPAARPGAPAQGCPPAVGTAGVGGRLTGATQCTAVCTAAATPLPGRRGPLGGGVSPRAGRGAAGLIGLSVGLGGERGEGGRRGGSPLSPPVPWCCSLVAAGGQPGGLGSGGSAVDGGGAHSPPARLHPPGARLSCGPSPSCPPLPSLLSRCRVVPAGGGGGGGGCWGWPSGSAGSD